ncbi:MAG: hypothetical protein ACK41T_07095 [Pseudobdellovibrio sp.]
MRFDFLKLSILFVCLQMLMVHGVFAQETPDPKVKTDYPENFSTTPKNYLLSAERPIKLDEDTLTFTAEKLLFKVAEDFQGAYLICDPYCQTVSLRMSDMQWKPNPESIKLYSKNIKLLPVEDPLFKYLYPDKAQEAEDILKEREKKLKEKEALDKKIANALAEEDKTKASEKKKQLPLVQGYRVSLGPRYTLIDQTTNNNVQIDFKPMSGITNISLGAGYWRGLQTPYLGQWWVFEIGFENDMYKSTTNMPNSMTLDASRSKMDLTAWSRKKGYSAGLKLTSLKQKYKVSRNTLNAFSFDEDIKFLGLAFKTGRFLVNLDYGLEQKIREEQPFRNKLKESSQYMVTGTFCQNPLKVPFVSTLMPCYGASYMKTYNSATFNTSYNDKDTVDLNRNDISLSVTLHLGGDYLR